MRTILQVEDDTNDVFFLKRAMKKGGLLNPVHVASDGQQAIDYLKGTGQFADRAQFPMPSLVLLDLKLPYVMGLDVLKWIRQKSGLPLVVVLLTASPGDKDITAAYRLGANGFLVKPSDVDKLEDMVKAIHQFWLTHNTPPPETHKEHPPGAYAMVPAALELPPKTGAQLGTWHPTAPKPKYKTARADGL
jgi:two-component system response regulator